MAFEISKEILDRTKCDNDFVCLSEKQCPRCKVQFTAGASYIMVEPNSASMGCSYAKPFGIASFVCTCPTRNEIYRKYGK